MLDLPLGVLLPFHFGNHFDQLSEHRYWVTNINFLCTKLGAGWSQQSHFCQKLLSSFFEFILMVNFFSENTTFTKWILEIENLLNLAVKKVFDCFNHIFTSCWCHRKCYFGTMRYPWVSCQKNTMCYADNSCNSIGIKTSAHFLILTGETTSFSASHCSSHCSFLQFYVQNSQPTVAVWNKQD